MSTYSNVPVPKGAVAPARGRRPGRLVIVGSGITSIAQLTLEAIAHMKHADKVFYTVADPGTDVYIQKLNKNAVDLYNLYDDGKNRHDTYVQMAEVLLSNVRKGFYVVGCFYGHPGVFANPPHRALTIALNEGYDAKMLAGISAEDCLYADLNIDPSRPGCQTLGASDIILRNRAIATDCHVILFQVGAVGMQGFDFKGFKDTKFPALVECLLKHYGPDHEVVHYTAALYTFAKPRCDRYTIKDLQIPEVAKKITGLSTFYLPPKVLLASTEEGCKKLGFKYNPNKQTSFGAFPPGQPYTARELDAIKSLSTHANPQNYRPTRMSPAFYDTLNMLATNPTAVQKYQAAPKAFAANVQGLSKRETLALSRGHSGLIRVTAQGPASDPATEFVQAELRDPSLVSKYVAIVKQYQNDPNGKEEIAAWLTSQGYNTTPDDVWTAYQNLINVSVDIYDGQYTTWLNGSSTSTPTIRITQGTVLDGTATIKKFSYASSVLSWNASDGNPSSAVLTFRMLTDDDGKPLPANSYIGPQFSGTYVSGSGTMPTSTNIYGKVGTPQPQPGPAQPTPISTWFATYTTYLKDASGKLQKDSTMAVSDAGSGNANITYGGKSITGFTYNNGALSWSTSGGNAQNVSLTFYMNQPPTDKNTIAGPQFSGKLWTADGQTPSTSNLWACKATGTDPSDPDKASGSAFSAAYWEMQAVNVAVMVVGQVLGHLATKAIDAFNAWRKAPTPENKAALDKANQDAKDGEANDDSIKNQSDNAEDAGGGDEPEPPQPDPPQQQQEEQEEQEHEEEQNENQQEQEEQEEHEEQEHEEQEQEEHEEEHEEEEEIEEGGMLEEIEILV